MASTTQEVRLDIADTVDVKKLPVDTAHDETSHKRNWTSLAVVPAAWLGHIATLGIVYSFGVMVPAMLEEWPYSTAGELGLLGSALMGAFFGVSILVGKIVVKIGHRRAALCGAILIVTGWLLVFVAQKPWQAYPGIAVLGFGLNLIWAPGLALLPAHFPNNKATATCIAVTGSGFGSLFWSWTLSTLLDRFGLRTSLLIAAGINGSLAFAAAAGYAPVPPKQTPPPTQQGNITGDESESCRSSAAVLGKASANDQVQDQAKGIIDVTKTPTSPSNSDRVLPLAKDPLYYVLCCATFSSCLGFMAPFTHVAAYSAELGCDDEVGAASYMAFGVLSIVGRLLAGPLGDRFGALVIWSAGMPLCAGALLWLGFATSCNQIIASMGAFGVFSGPVIALLAPLLVELFGLPRLPVALGPMLQINGLASMAAPAIAGHVRDLTSSYTVSFVVASAFTFNASAVMMLVRHLNSRRHQCTKPVPAGKPSA